MFQKIARAFGNRKQPDDRAARRDPMVPPQSTAHDDQSQMAVEEDLPEGSLEIYSGLRHTTDSVFKSLKSIKAGMDDNPGRDSFELGQVLLEVSALWAQINRKRIELAGGLAGSIVELPNELKEGVQELIRFGLAIATRMLHKVPISKRRHDVFVSFAGEERSYAKDILVKHFEDKKLTVFFDTDSMRAGETSDASQAMLESILSAKSIVFVASFDAVQKKWPLAELLCALARNLKAAKARLRYTPLIVDAFPGSEWLASCRQSEEWVDNLKDVLSLKTVPTFLMYKSDLGKIVHVQEIYEQVTSVLQLRMKRLLCLTVFGMALFLSIVAIFTVSALAVAEELKGPPPPTPSPTISSAPSATPSLGPLVWNLLTTQRPDPFDEYYGRSIALSEDARMLVVGGSGVVHIYDADKNNTVFRRRVDKSNRLSNQGNGFGVAMDLSFDGYYLAVGDHTTASDISVSVFYWGGGSWSPLGQTITVPRRSTDIMVLAMARRTHDTIAIGTANRVEVYELQNSEIRGQANVWTRRGSAFLSGEMTPSGQTFQWIGLDGTVALSEDGSVLALGDPTGCVVRSGCIRVFAWHNKTWTQRGEDIQGDAPNSRFGRSVALSSDGLFVAGGANFGDPERNRESNAGHVQAFLWDGVTWSQVGQDLYGESDTQIEFGRKIATNRDGSTLAVVAPFTEESGTLYIYGLSRDEWILRGQELYNDPESVRSSFFGRSVVLSGDGYAVAYATPDFGSNGRRSLQRIGRKMTYASLYEAEVGVDYNELISSPTSQPSDPCTGASGRPFESTQELYAAFDLYMADPSLTFEYGSCIGDWDVSRVENFDRLFDTLRNWTFPVFSQYYPWKSFTEDVSRWNTSSAVSMVGMFYHADRFNGDISAWDVSRVVNASHMFAYSSFNGDISDWDVSSILNTSNMFSRSKFNRDLATWKTNRVVDFRYMFRGAKAFNENISDWDTSAATMMRGLFSAASSFNQPLAKWEVGKVTHMDLMFNAASSFNQGLSHWNTSNLINAEDMFLSALLFNGDLSGWDTQSLQNAESMFSGANSFDQDIAGWNTSSLTNTKRMFGGSAFNRDISGWDVSRVQDASAMFGLATAFNQNLCQWRTRLPSNASVDNMFGFTYRDSSTACPDQEIKTPVLPFGPMCHFCY